MKKGFTLIELLVVVLIIGILSAIAIPQYQVSVEKTKAANLLSLLASVAQAEEVYYLANGKYTDQMHDLDVQVDYVRNENKYGGVVYQLPEGHWFMLDFHASVVRGGTDYVQINRYLNYSPQEKKVVCYALTGTIGEPACKSLGVKNWTGSQGCGMTGTVLGEKTCRYGNIE
ncbi:MAG: prepilin-type N-terminal cleavage/methylation domain-containing protein [Elusimicrobiaceae bacterium]|nr:prepilin-type N-terminal cleavage/methylation domain-containing protein [Elusimicrobiaceae bacterium]